VNDTRSAPAKRRRPILKVLLGLIGASVAAYLLWLYQPWPKPPIGPIVASDDAQGQWPIFGADWGGTRYSPLSQINRGNVQGLEQAWSYTSGEYAKLGPVKASQVYSYQTTPILFGGNLIGCTHRHAVFALDPETGAERWRYDPGLTPTPKGDAYLKCRGVTGWTDPALPVDAPCKDRIIYGASTEMIELDARNGRLCKDFGTDGIVAVEIPGMEVKDEVQLRSPPAIAGDVAIFGTTMFDVNRANAPSGKLRAFDLRSGALRWEYDPVPHDPADPAYATWGKGSADYSGAANVWSFVSVDPVNKLVFVPAGQPTSDFYGTDRPGKNLWTDSLVALDATTGKQVWGYQLTHHDLWDYDPPAMPILVDITKDGQKIPAVIQLTKQSFVFVFNRLTGEPVYPIVEKPVPQQTDIPDMGIWPTQPYPTGIPPLVKAGLRPGDAWGFTPYDRGACRDLIASYQSDGLYTPPTRKGTIGFPGGAGGMNWGGGAVDPTTGTLYVPNFQIPQVIKLVPREGPVDPRRPGQGAEEGPFPMRGTPYVVHLSFLLSPWGAPCSPPPWATFSAVNLSTGTVKWQVTLGTIENLHPLAPPIKLGAPFSGGPIVTAGGIVFMAGTADKHIRAFDTETGDELWTASLPASGMAVPMTYSIHGKQYVVIAAGGNNLFPGPMGDSLVAFALKPGWRR